MTMLQSTLSMLGVACCLAMAVAACDAEPDQAELSFRPGGGGWGCPDCGYSNSPMFGPFPLDTYRVGRPPSGSTDLWLVALENPAGVPYPARVDVQELVAETPAGDVEGGALQGWSLVFDDGVAKRKVRISAFEQHLDWVDGDTIPTYGLAYREAPEDPYVNVCPGIDADETSVVLITDELYDVETKTVDPGQTGWVTMACRGHAIMKMKFMGHDPHDIYGSSWEQRQAALKMITADYCGEGHSFTTVGQPLAWIDELGNFPQGGVPSIDAVEARWSEDGALCLDQPRYVTPSEVAAFCKLPTCGGDIDLDDAQWMSFIPKL
jgi:hypothetical protein